MVQNFKMKLARRPKNGTKSLVAYYSKKSRGKGGSKRPNGANFLSAVLFGGQAAATAQNKVLASASSSWEGVFRLYFSEIIPKSMTIPIIGAVILGLTLIMLAISLIVHLRYAERRRIRLIMFSYRALWFHECPGQGEAIDQVIGYHYMYKQSHEMAHGNDSPSFNQRYLNFVTKGLICNNQKHVDFILRRGSLWMPHDNNINSVDKRYQRGIINRWASLTNSSGESTEPSRQRVMIVRDGDESRRSVAVEPLPTLTLRRSLSQFELVMPHSCYDKTTINSSQSLTDLSQTPIWQRASDQIKTDEQIDRSQLHDLLANFQWRVKHARAGDDLRDIVEEYTDRCLKEVTKKPTLPVAIPRPDELSLEPSSSSTIFNQNQSRVRHSLIPRYTSSIYIGHRKIFANYTAARAVRNYRLLSTSKSNAESERSEVSKRKLARGIGKRLWRGVTDFFSPTSRPHRNDSNTTQTHTSRHGNEDGGTGGGGGGPSAMLLFGRTTHDSTR